MIRKTLFIAIVASLALLSAAGQKNQADPAVTMMMNVEKGSEGIRDFVATIEVSVDMERVRVPRMTATMYFKKPDKVHFSSTNFAMLPREGVALNPSLLRERYVPKILGEDEIDGRKVKKLDLTGKGASIRPNRLMIWIDPGTWTISRIETVPYQGRNLRLEFMYAPQAGGYVLPQLMKATFEIAARDSLQKRLDLDVGVPSQFEEVQRPSRSGSITVKYLEYKVNVGLSDDLFEKRDDPSKTK